MTDTKRLARNPRLMFWAKALYEAKLLTAIVVPFYLARGLDEAQILQLNVVFSATTLVAEVPSGYLADRIGRRNTMLVGLGLLLAFLAMSFFAYGMWQFCGLFVLYATAYACFSGAEEALLFETTCVLKREKDYTASFGRLTSARSMFKMFLPSLAAVLASDRTEAEFAVLIAINVVLGLAAFVIMTRVTEPPRAVSTEIRLLPGLRVAFRDRTLVRMALNRAVMRALVLAIWQMYQPMLIRVGLSAGAWLGAFYFLMQLGNFTLARLAGRLGERFGTRVILQGTVALSALSVVAVLALPYSAVTFLGLMAAICIGGARVAHVSRHLNARIPSNTRATTLSALQLLRVVDIPILMAASWLAGIHLSLMYGAAAAAMVALFVLLPIRRSDLALPS